MLRCDVDAMNSRFAIADHVSFRRGPGGLAVAEVVNGHGSAVVGLAGGHVMAYQPRGEEPVLWMSERSRFAVGEPMRGGIPICWPWFGPHPEDGGKPAHGFARTALWEVVETGIADGGATRVELRLRDDATSRAVWPHPFELRLAVTVGRRLRVELTARNIGQQPFTCTGALHSYFHVSDVTNAAVHGLEGCEYIDKVDHHRRKRQTGPVTVGGEVDRIYTDTTGDCVVEDAGLGRRIRIGKAGSRSTVVWNPWIAKAARLEDFGDEEYRGMLCVETANAGDDAVTIPPGNTHQLTAEIGVEPRTAR